MMKSLSWALNADRDRSLYLSADNLPLPCILSDDLRSSTSMTAISPRPSRFLGAFLVFAAATQSLPAQSPAPVKITVTRDVIRSAEQMPPLGLNEMGDIGSVKYSAGNLIQGGGYEPIQLRSLYRVVETGVENGRHFVRIDMNGTSNYQQYNSGFYSGGTMRAYRLVDPSGKALPFKDAAWAEGGKILDVRTAQKVVSLGTMKVLPRGVPGLLEGGWQVPGPEYVDITKTSLTKEQIEENRNQRVAAQKNWRAYYEGDQELLVDDVVIFEKRIVSPAIEDIHPRFRSDKGIVTPWTLKSGSASQVAHAAGLPAKMDGGESCLLLESNAETGVFGVRNMFGATGREDSFWYGQLEPGVTYRYEAWMKQEGMSAPKVQLTFGTGDGVVGYGDDGTQIGREFAVDQQWKLYGFDFVAPERPTGTKWLGGPVITFAGVGKLYLDNIKLQPVYEPGDAEKPFVVNRTTLKNIVETQPATGRKGAMRIWSGLTFASMKSWLNWNIDSRLSFGIPMSVGPNQPATLPKALLICEATGDSPATRMVPWIIAQVTFTEAEYAGLIEYLAAPYDPSKDTAQSKPYAYLRTLERGNNQPWTDTFRELILEFGNENWHNRKNAAWVGFGRFASIHQAGKEYGLFTRYFIEGMKKSPAWNEAVAAKIHFCLGGNYSSKIDSYGQLASLANRENTYQGMAVYDGPRWELNEAGQTELNDSGFRKTLVCGLLLQNDLEAQGKVVKEMEKQGVKVQMAGYEVGPSGYDLGGKNKIGEAYGKSLAMAPAAFDGWMLAAANGWTYQNFFVFGQGVKWNSHTSYSQGFRPSPGFLGLVLRNRFMSGDLLKATVDTPPVEPVELSVGRGKDAHIEPKDIAMIGAYAMGDAKHLSVAIVSRSLDKTYPARIRVPMNKVTKITLHSLKGDPRKTNTEDLNSAIVTENLPITALNGDVLSYDVPPGSITVFELE